MVELCDLNIESKNDLYTEVLVCVGRDYHGRKEYEHTTVWGVINNIVTFKKYLDMLTSDEVTNFRDGYGGTILHEMAIKGFNIDYFRLIYEKVGYENFINMLLTKGSYSSCAISLVTNHDAFKILLEQITITSDILKQIVTHNVQQNIDYVTSLINN